MVKTWTVEYCPIPNRYMLMLWIDNKAYYLDISKEFAETLGGASMLEGLIEQDYINENIKLKVENASLREKLNKYEQSSLGNGTNTN